MLEDRRQAAFPGEFLARVGAAWLVICTLLLLVNWNAISNLHFPDPDDTLRLIQVRDLIAGQAWYDVTQYRVDALGGGVPMHWSRLVDIPIALVILALTPLVGVQDAELAALIIVPLITLGIAMLLAARIAWRQFGPQETTLTALVLVVCVPVVFQLAPLRIDHHGWQLVCALIAMNGLMARSPIVGGAVIGASLATWLSISIEGLPLSAAFFAVLAWRWLRHPRHSVIVVAAILSLAVTSAVLFVATRGLSDFAAYCDAISPVHIAMFGLGALVLTVLARFEPLPLAVRLGGFAVAGGGALAMLFAVAPHCAVGGGFAELDPLVAEHWHVRVKEGMPVWHQKGLAILQYAITPFIGLYGAIRLAQTSYGWKQKFWSDYALLVGAAILISLLVARAGSVACLVAAPPLAWQLNRWLVALRGVKRPLPRVAALIAIACALLPTLPYSVSTLVMPAQAGTQGAVTAPGTLGANAMVHLKLSNCRISDSADLLNALEPGEVFAPLDIAPRILLTSHHSVPATGHHRGDETMRLVIATAIGTSEAARETLQARGSRYFALCPRLIEPTNYSLDAPNGFMADLLNQRELDWLEPIPVTNGSTLRLWRIKPE